MEIQSTTSVQNTQSTTTQQNTTNETNALFQNILSKNKSPQSITYQEYKNLTKNEIKELYPKETMSKENAKAISLYTRANGSDDEVLNQVLFDKELNSDDSDFIQRAGKSIDMMLDFWESLEKFKISLDKTDQYMKDNNISFSKDNLDESMNLFSQIHTQMYKETVVPQNQKKITAEELFEVFEYNKVGIEANIKWNNYTKDDEQYKYYQEKINYNESIKTEYLKKIEDNNTILESYTKNNKPNPLESIEK